MTDLHLSRIRLWLMWVFVALMLIFMSLANINLALEKIARAQAIIASPPR